MLSMPWATVKASLVHYLVVWRAVLDAGAVFTDVCQVPSPPDHLAVLKPAPGAPN